MKGVHARAESSLVSRGTTCNFQPCLIGQVSALTVLAERGVVAVCSFAHGRLCMDTLHHRWPRLRAAFAAVGAACRDPRSLKAHQARTTPRRGPSAPGTATRHVCTSDRLPKSIRYAM